MGDHRVLGRAAVDVELQPSHGILPEQSEAAFRDELQSLIADLLGCLAVPIGIDLTISRTHTSSVGRADAPYVVMVDGRRCRVERRAGDVSALSSAGLARTIAEDLCRNRQLFVSPQLCERLHADWAHQPGGSIASLSGDMFRLLLVELVERGIRLDRIKGLIVSAHQARDVRLCHGALEEMIAASGAIALRVWLSGGLHRRLCAETSKGDQRSFSRLLPWGSDRVFSDRGVLMDPPVADVDPGLGVAEFRLQLNDLRWPPLEGLADGEWLVVAPAERLQELGIGGSSTIHPWTGMPCVRVSGDDDLLERCRSVGVTIGAAGVIVASLRLMAVRHAGHLLTAATVRCQLDLLRQIEPVLVAAALGRFDSLDLTWILRGVVDGGVSIRDFRTVLEILLSLEGSRASALVQARSAAAADVAYWVDWIREGLKRQISSAHSGAGNTVGVQLMAPQLERRIAASDDHPLDDLELNHLLDALTRAQALQERPLVVLTSQDVARRLRCLIRCELPRVAVISYQELSPDANIQPYGRIGGS